MNILETMSMLIGQSEYLGMHTKVSSNKQDSINNVRTVPKRSTIADHKRRSKQGRNEPCNCGSGKKFKKCCGKIINENKED